MFEYFKLIALFERLQIHLGFADSVDLVTLQLVTDLAQVLDAPEYPALVALTKRRWASAFDSIEGDARMPAFQAHFAAHDAVYRELLGSPLEKFNRYA
jgi:hypothetical protein